MGGASSRFVDVEKTVNWDNVQFITVGPEWQYWECYGPYLNKLLEKIGHYMILTAVYKTSPSKTNRKLETFYNALSRVLSVFYKGDIPNFGNDKYSIAHKVEEIIKRIHNRIREAEISVSNTSRGDIEKIKGIYQDKNLIYSVNGKEITFYEVNQMIENINKVAESMGLIGVRNEMLLSPTPNPFCRERNPKLEYIMGGFQWSSPMGKAILIAVIVFLIVIIFIKVVDFRSQKKEIKAVEDTYRGWRGF